MSRFLSDLFWRVFGCHHSNVSRPFTLRSRTYRVCCGCGAEFDYSLKTMSFTRSSRALYSVSGAAAQLSGR
jgi:hypothetical protein